MAPGGQNAMVFTPLGQRLLPALDSFGGGLSQTLKLILGNLFADASAVLDADGAQPVFLFSPPTLSGADLDVELLDLRWFRPVTLSLRWINDYMMVRSPRRAEAQALTQLAEDLYEGEIAVGLHGAAESSVEALRSHWAEGEAVLQSEIDAVLNHLTEEVGRSIERMRLGRKFLADATERMKRMDDLIEAARSEIEAATVVAARAAGLAPALVGERFTLVADLMAEIEAGDKALERAEERVRAQLDKIEALTRRMQHG